MHVLYIWVKTGHDHVKLRASHDHHTHKKKKKNIFPIQFIIRFLITDIRTITEACGILKLFFNLTLNLQNHY